MGRRPIMVLDGRGKVGEAKVVSAEDVATSLHARVAELEAELAREREDSRDIPTIAYMSGAADWKRRAEAAEVERDSLRAKVERLERVREAATRYCRASGHRDTHNADAYLRAALAECEEGKP